jgi:lactate dehydrogenase-like 2-hydroxyacid dehydrogenase
VNDSYIRKGYWSKKGNTPLSRAVDGMSVGILGYGRIGQAIARKLEAFNCQISYHARTERPDSPHRYYDNLTRMANDVTALIVITPGGPSTHHLVNAAVIEALGPEGILVNVARGSVVDENALVAALQNESLGAAGLDVFAAEPHVPEVLFTMDNVVLTPHIGSATIETRRAMGDLTVDNIVQYFSDGQVITPIPECRHLTD